MYVHDCTFWPGEQHKPSNTSAYNKGPVHIGVHVSNDKDRVTSNTKSHKPTTTPSRELIWKTTAVA